MRKCSLQPLTIFLSVFSAALLVGIISISARAAHTPTAAIGHPAPTFSLPNVGNGHTVSLNSLTHGKKATVVIFISTRCPVSNAYNGRMTDLAKKYGPLGISFVGIDSNQTEPTAECASWSATAKLGFPMLKDSKNVIADYYGATHTPEAYVIDPSGKLIYHGRIDSDMDESSAKYHDLAAALDDVLAGKPIVKQETKAFGCTIKRVEDGY
jgi:peroxiredoxin